MKKTDNKRRNHESILSTLGKSLFVSNIRTTRQLIIGGYIINETETETETE